MAQLEDSLKPCAQCGTQVAAADRVDTVDRSFCRTCYGHLEAQLREAALQTSRDIPYANAFAGAVLGGAAGALLWWGFTALTSIAFGLVAIAIGFLVGHGAVRFSGGKRSRELQVMCVVVALASFLVASYLVNMTFINRALEQQGDARRVSFPPGSLTMFLEVVKLNFGLMDVVFVGITLYEAWKIPRPLEIPPSRTS